MRIENLEIIWGINRQKLKKNADACRIWPLLVIIPNTKRLTTFCQLEFLSTKYLKQVKCIIFIALFLK